jgi:hypothetical protein
MTSLGLMLMVLMEISLLIACARGAAFSSMVQ